MNVAERTLAAEARAVDVGMTRQQFRNFMGLIVTGTDDECWPWTGALNDRGWGKYHGTGAHRWAYTILVGDIPEGLTIDHLCKNRRCCNPAHMEPVTVGENTLRGNGPTAINAAKTHCVNGHEFTEENTYHEARGRQCRQCRADNDRRYKLARRTLAAEERAVAEGHHALLNDDGSIRVVSDTRPGKHYTVVVAMGLDVGEGVYFTCHPTGVGCYDDDHRWISSPAMGHAPCKHAALAARRLEREGSLCWDAGRWVVTPAAASKARARVADQPDDPFQGLPA